MSTTKPGFLCLDHYNWFGLRYDTLAGILESSGYAYHSYNVRFPGREAGRAADGAFYRDVNIDAAICYTLCNELEIVPSQINPQDEEHRAVIAKWKSIAMSGIDYALEVIDERRIVRMMIPQGYVLEAALCRLIANRLGLPLLAIENCLVKDRLLWDNVSGITVNENLAKNYYWKYQDVVNAAAANVFVQNYLHKIRSLKSDEHAAPQNAPEIPSDKKLIVYLGQVYVDSSVLFGLYRGFRDQIDIIEFLAEYAKRNDCALIIKMHPKESMGNSIVDRPLNRLTWRKLSQSATFMERYHGLEDIIVDYDNRFDTYELIRKADVCVTINSMAGLESCLLDIPTITCGYSSYGCLGFTSEASDKCVLSHFLDFHTSHSAKPVHFDSCNRFFFVYLNLYCMEKSEKALADKLIAR